jgi:hypothetical protein
MLAKIRLRAVHGHFPLLRPLQPPSFGLGLTLVRLERSDFDLGE